MMRQLPLGIRLKPGIGFDNFVAGDNAQALASLKACVRGEGDPFIFLWGGSGTGKSHLLQAACQQADDLGRFAAYIPLRQAGDFRPEICENLERLELVCLDDVEQIAGEPAWEQAIFRLFNRLRDRGGHLLAAANQSPAALNLNLTLPDLSSRLLWGLSYRLHPLSEEKQLQVLSEAALGRGLEMPEETARYLLRRCPREMGFLLSLLNHLDLASLADQRRLTVPFVREQLERLKNSTG